MEREGFCREMSEFIIGLAGEEAGGQAAGVVTVIGEDDNLFDLGLVNSFTIIQIIVYLEKLTGVSIDLTAHELESFYTIHGIYDLVQGGAA
jgi:acyl carrier protein